jgi:hypothetical protein
LSPPNSFIPLDDQLISQLVDRAKVDGIKLTGEGGLLQQLTKKILESALEGEITDHLGHEKHEKAASGNTRNGTRAKTVVTEVGPVEIEVPRDRAGSFEPRTPCRGVVNLMGVKPVPGKLRPGGGGGGGGVRPWWAGR